MQSINERDRRGLGQIVSENIMQYIIDRKLQAGNKIPSERDLSKILDVSRPVIREGLSALEAVGVIHIRHGEGAFVKEPNLSPLFEQIAFHWRINESKMKELIHFRLMMELAAIEQVIHLGERADFTEIEKIVEQMDSPNITLAETRDLDIAFHKALAKTANNETFTQMMEAVLSLFMNVHYGFSDSAQADQQIDEHKQILTHLKAGDRIEADKWMRLHLDVF